MGVRGPNSVGKSCANRSNMHCCTTLGDHGEKEMLVSNFAQQLPTTRNNKTTGCANGRNMQHPTMLGVVDQQCCTVCMGLNFEENKRMQEGVT